LPEFYRTSLYTDVPQEELRLTLASQTVHFEVYRAAESGDKPILLSRLSLPLSLWDQFYEAVCCLGTFMKPLPAPAYQTRSCCSYTCALTPETVVLEHNRKNIHLSLQDRRGSTFLEIKSLPSAAAVNSGETHTIRIGPTLWSAFMTTLEKLAHVIAGV
jgi:hypothetical protein